MKTEMIPIYYYNDGTDSPFSRASFEIPERVIVYDKFPIQKEDEKVIGIVDKIKPMDDGIYAEIRMIDSEYIEKLNYRLQPAIGGIYESTTGIFTLTHIALVENGKNVDKLIPPIEFIEE